MPATVKLLPPLSLKLLFDTRAQPDAVTEIDPLAVIPDVLPDPVCKASRQGCGPVPADVVWVTSLVELALTVTDGCEVNIRDTVSGTDFCTLTSTAASDVDFNPWT